MNIIKKFTEAKLAEYEFPGDESNSQARGSQARGSQRCLQIVIRHFLSNNPVRSEVPPVDSQQVGKEKFSLGERPILLHLFAFFLLPCFVPVPPCFVTIILEDQLGTWAGLTFPLTFPLGFLLSFPPRFPEQACIALVVTAATNDAIPR